jgi:hypothetical protein
MVETTLDTLDDSLLESYGSMSLMISVTSLCAFTLAACIYYLKLKMKDDPKVLFADAQPVAEDEVVRAGLVQAESSDEK